MPSEKSNIYTDLGEFHDAALDRGDVMGSWGFSSNIDFTRMSSEENNVWFFEQVFNFLRAFFGIVMPDQVELITYNATKQINREKLDQMTFLDELMLIMKNLKEPIWVQKLNLSIVGFIRSDWDPDNPIRVRIQEPASFICWGGPDETGFQTFNIGYKLFNSQLVEKQGVAFWSLNQPLLQKALGKWEKQTGRTINVVEGNSPDLPLYRHGFSKPAPVNVKSQRPRHEGGAQPAQKRPAPEEPADDFFPDLDDLKA